MKQYWEALGDNHYGEVLKNNVRFESFKPDIVTNGDWEYLLGDDVNQYRHMDHTATITSDYIAEHNRISRPLTWLDAYELLQCAWTHDFAEAIDGDVPDPEKDTSIEAQRLERLSFFTVAQSINAQHLTEGVMDITQGRHRMSRHFRAIELFGYHQTAKRAQDEATNLVHRRPVIDFALPKKRMLTILGLNQLHDEVAPKAIAGLQNNFSDLPAVASYLRRIERESL